MSLSAGNRRNGIKKAQQLLPGTQPVGYAVGRTGANPVLILGTIVGGFVLVNLILTALTGAFIFPGLLLVMVASHYLSPPVGVVVAAEGVALTKRSLWNGRPSEVTAVMAHGYLRPAEQSLGMVKMMVGNEAVWMTKGEEKMLREVANQAAITPAPATGPAPYGASAPLGSTHGHTNEIFTEGLGWFARSFVVGILYTFGSVILIVSVIVLFEGKPDETVQGMLMATVPLALAEGLRRLTRPKPRVLPTH